ncbi:MAG: DUF72 domain-containing protein, partial [Acidobacteriota bacterium]
MLRVGTAGWCYPDWEGIVYPKGASARKDALRILAHLFGTLEINVSFYRPPSPRMAAGWVKQVASRPSFLFTAKLWRGFTHQRDGVHAREEGAFRDGTAPLRESGRLGALLIQFPHSFRNTVGNLGYLESLLDRFGDFPLVVELRHTSWMQEKLFAMLRERGV